MLKIINILAMIFLIVSCAPKPEPVRVVVPIVQPNEVRASITEGKTTKQEVIDALGTPDSLGAYWTYDFRKKMNEICKLTLVDKAGVTLNLLVGPNEKYHQMMLFFSDSKNPGVVSGVSLI